MLNVRYFGLRNIYYEYFDVKKDSIVDLVVKEEASLDKCIEMLLKVRAHDNLKYDKQKSPFGSGINYIVDYEIVIWHGGIIGRIIVINDKYRYDGSWNYNLDIFMLINKENYTFYDIKRNVKNMSCLKAMNNIY
jgi:hypothetical protein